MNRAGDESRLCGVLSSREDNSVEGQTYRISCEGKCGDGLMLVVNHHRDEYAEDSPACIHMSELGVHFSGHCMAGYYETIDGCEMCPMGTWKDMDSSSCNSCSDGETSDAGSTSQSDCRKHEQT